MSSRDEPLVLGIETSCDETGVGIVRGQTLLVDAVASSVQEHARFGGVVPEIASRAHLEAMPQVMEEALGQAGVDKPDAVAATVGPGLAGALLVGASAAKAYAAAWGVPFYGVNHLGGHVAVALTAGAGWAAERRQRALDVIVRHNWPSVDPALDLEGHLLEIATGLDISGARADALPQEFVREVLDAHPRLTLAEEFTAGVTDQAARKPTTAARRLVDGGLAAKLAHHPLEPYVP